MARESKYVTAAAQVLDELGGGPVPSKTLIDAIVEKGLLEDRKYLYHNVLRKVRESDLFDTSKRGFVSLATQDDASSDETEAIAEQAEAEALVEESEEAEAAAPSVTQEIEVPDEEVEQTLGSFSS